MENNNGKSRDMRVNNGKSRDICTNCKGKSRDMYCNASWMKQMKVKQVTLLNEN